MARSGTSGRQSDGHYERLRRKCDHPEDRKSQIFTKDGKKDGIKCLDCYSQRERNRRNRVKRASASTTRDLKVNDTGTPPSDEVLRGALCGDTADNRFIMLPNLLSEDDEDELNRWCSGCPVRMGCFEWATENRHFIGVAGGHTFGFNKQGRRVTKPLRAKEAVA